MYDAGIQGSRAVELLNTSATWRILVVDDDRSFCALMLASDSGLLADTASLILTVHDFHEPDDIREFHKPLDLDQSLDPIAGIAGQAQRRRTAVRQGAPTRASAADRNRRRPSREARIDLVLYISPASEKCQRALRTIRAVLKGFNPSQVNLTVCDLSTRSCSAEEDAVLFTPTLVKRGPGPRTWIVGNLDQPDLIADLLEVSGVERLKD